jgi:hypothetical protein
MVVYDPGTFEAVAVICSSIDRLHSSFYGILSAIRFEAGRNLTSGIVAYLRYMSVYSLYDVRNITP